MQALRSFRLARWSQTQKISVKSNSHLSTTPWFVDAEDTPVFSRRAIPPHLQPLPQGVPDVLKRLHAELSQSPHLEPSTVIVREPITMPMGPPLPQMMPKGRRKRGGTYFGEGVMEPAGGIWSWVVMAQVKEGTEKRGGIESVVRLVRRTLLTMNPPLPLPPNSKRRMHHGWAMIDAGEFAVHVLSGDAMEKYFTGRRDW